VKETVCILLGGALSSSAACNPIFTPMMEYALSELLESGTLPARVICMNTGIFYTTEGSPVLDLMEQLEAAGTEIRSCGTCLAYYGRADQLKVGAVGNMRETVRAMQSARKVLQP